MTSITVSITLDNSCNLSVMDTSGFYDGTDNTTGFLPETDSSGIALNAYKLSQGYFLNVLTLNKYASTPVIANPSESFYHVSSVNTTYSANFTPSIYLLSFDGVYTLTRYFVPSSTWYAANSSNEIFASINMFYTDGTAIYNVVGGTPTVITVTAFIATNFTGSNVISNATTFISTCNLNACYFKLLSTILEMNIGAAIPRLPYPLPGSNIYPVYPTWNPAFHPYDGFPGYVGRHEGDNNPEAKHRELIYKRDLLYMSLETIKYLKDVNNLSQIEKLIEVLDVCGGLCGSILNTPPYSDCGCNR